jgi:hypothetical protein
MQLNLILWILYVLFVSILLYYYCRYLRVLRNEAEYRDIIEYQTMLIAALLDQHPDLLNTLHTIRYFPDQSGYFTILNFDGKIVSQIPECSNSSLPVDIIIETARRGGGYVKYNNQGNIYDCFAYSYPGSKYIVCSGIFNNPHNIQTREHKWKQIDKSLLKTPLNPKKK